MIENSTPYLGPAVVAQLIAIWVNQMLPNWRWHPLVVLALTLAWAAATAAAHGTLAAARLPELAWSCLVAASVAVFGKECVLNLAGLANIGPRRAESVRRLNSRDASAASGDYWL